MRSPEYQPAAGRILPPVRSRRPSPESELTPEEIDAEIRVNKGAARIDAWHSKSKRDWRRNIDPERLDVSTATNCPLGQVYGSFATAISSMGIHAKETIQEHGFEGKTPEDQARLIAAWKREIKKAPPFYMPPPEDERKRLDKINRERELQDRRFRYPRTPILNPNRRELWE